MYPSATPIIVLLAHPASTVSNPNAITDSEYRSSSAGEASEFSHFLGKGSPHNPGFPTNESFVNVLNCVACGITPVRLLRRLIFAAEQRILKASTISYKLMTCTASWHQVVM